MQHFADPVRMVLRKSAIPRLAIDVDQSLRQTNDPKVLNAGGCIQIGLFAAIRFEAAVSDLDQQQYVAGQGMLVAIIADLDPDKIRLGRRIEVRYRDRILDANLRQLLDDGFGAPSGKPGNGFAMIRSRRHFFAQLPMDELNPTVAQAIESAVLHQALVFRKREA